MAAKEQWESKSYNEHAAFVPALATKVVKLLDLQKEDIVLDIGCGDGTLTAKLAPHCHTIIGIDSSPSFITSALSTIKPSHPNTDFITADCRRVSSSACPTESISILKALSDEKYTKVFSNAALHWILRDEGTREPFFRDVYELLKPGGKFVFEMGSAGNVAEVHAACIAVLRWKYGVSFEAIRRVGNPEGRPGDPWFFPSTDWIRQAMEGAGFEIEVCESEYRPTRMAGRGKGREDEGLRGWLRIMGASFWGLVEEGRREECLEDVCEVLGDITGRVEDAGARWVGFVRIRGVGRKVVRRGSLRRGSAG